MLYAILQYKKEKTAIEKAKATQNCQEKVANKNNNTATKVVENSVI